jgi:chitinase
VASLQNSSFVRAVYYAEWSTSATVKVSDIDGSIITHLIYAFATIQNGSCVLPNEPSSSPNGTVQEIQKLKQRFPHLKTMLSIGGWGGSSEFSEAALTEQNRIFFAQTCVDLATQFDFDGLDIDWEVREIQSS